MKLRLLHDAFVIIQKAKIFVNAFTDIYYASILYENFQVKRNTLLHLL